MRTSRRRPPVVPLLLCALAVLAARPDTQAAGPGSEAGVSAQVARLYREAAVATRQYEAGRREAVAQRAVARRAERLLHRERGQVAVLHADLGRIARAQYRTGGGLPLTAQLLLADGPDELMRGQRVFSQTDLAVSHAIGRSRRAEARLAAGEAKAEAARQAAEKQTARLTGLKKDIERKLEEARAELQGRADVQAAAGRCGGAVRLNQPRTRTRRAWVAPVERYELSAGFGRGGSRWAHRHTGQDFAVPIGTPVRAVGAGRVVKVSCGGAFGMEIVIRHSAGVYTQYAHLAAVAVEAGDKVPTGRWIAQSGTTGNSTGPHLHFEVRRTPEIDSVTNPVPWLARHGVKVR
ncbi:M23 family metallopeptidase [Streptomyces brasiliensis]|uniref:Peptidase n=1 Tax=Streptomyces brasiliensis TaxID=1954 RepID=A0A917KHZ3_9ACTN|nr:M23 family metallopeptidase [Streptomyces brasiliensis]GGJ14705.1 peptidase [Streptomyces brasiliensis]